jgi:transposase-like protein
MDASNVRSDLAGAQTNARADTRSRMNALKHGLTSTTLLTYLLGSDVIARHKARLSAEWCPATPTQGILVEEMARHAAALELAERAEAAVLRCGFQSVEFIASSEVSRVDPLDAALVAAFTSDGVERLSRYRRMHEKGFFAALLRMREAKAAEPAPSQHVFLESWTEAGCRAYLVGRLQHADHRCPRCEHPSGYLLAKRHRWECAGCGKQFGLRAGTVMESSRLPLHCWFAAIEALLPNSEITVPELSRRIGVRRLATVRSLAAKVRAAFCSPKSSELLMGLDQYWCPRGVPATCAVPEASFAKREKRGGTSVCN